MRVTMYTEDYVPLAVIDAPDAALDWLRRNPGDEVQFMESLPLYSAQPLARVPVMNQYRGRIVVEGMEWADGVTRPILVVKGRSLCEALLATPGHVASAAYSLFQSALYGMRGTDVTNDRWRFVASHPPLYEGHIHGDTLGSGSLNLGQQAVETAAARLARDIDNDFLRNSGALNPARTFRRSPLNQDAAGVLSLAGAVTSGAAAQTASAGAGPRITMADIGDRAAEIMDRMNVPGATMEIRSLAPWTFADGTEGPVGEGAVTGTTRR
jgi:hypothetical protein